MFSVDLLFTVMFYSPFIGCKRWELVLGGEWTEREKRYHGMAVAISKSGRISSCIAKAFRVRPAKSRSINQGQYKDTW